ncbi:MAG: hypothetical protein KBS60_04845 [Phascolarctobacterium sp.]|nr:hypothetical protein [Candidatus Phascolarctobacterium caballi]
MMGLTKKQIYYITGAILLISMALELCGVHLHAPHWWPLPFGYNVLFGFVGGWLLIIVSKMIMAPLLQRPEDYYDEKGGEEE